MARSSDKQERKWCRMPGDYNGVTVDRGQIISGSLGPKNERLIAMDYFVPFEADREPYTCVECGKEFSEDVWRAGHFERRHREKVAPLPGRMSDETDGQYSERVMAWKEHQDDIEARQLERELAKMPPNLEKTLATQHG